MKKHDQYTGMQQVFLRLCCVVIAASAVFRAGAAAGATPPLVINEVMSNPNPDAVAPYGFVDQAESRFITSDWIEIYNKGDTPVELAGFYLSDDCMLPDKWRIPEEAGLVVPAHGTLVIWAAGHFRGVSNCAPDPNQDYIPCPNPIPPTVAPFRLAGGGEWIGLYDKDGATLIDGFEIPPLPPDGTFGCYPDGDTTNRGFLAAPTVGEVVNSANGPLARGAPNEPRTQVGPVVNIRSFRGVRVVDGQEVVSPVVEPGDEIRVLVEAYDPDDPDPLDSDSNLAEVTLHWKRTRAGRERIVAMEQRSDDPSGKLYEARIPAQNPTGPDDPASVIAFYVVAADKEGNVTEVYADQFQQKWFQIPIGGRGDLNVDLVINEVLAANAGCPEYDEGEVQDPTAPVCYTGGQDSGKTAERSEAEDWVEVYNRAASAIDLDTLKSLYITNNELKPTQLSLADLIGHSPAMQGSTFPPRTHALIWCDGEPYENDEVGLHAPFQLNAGEDEVFLIAYQDVDDDGDPELYRVLDVISWGPAEGRLYGPARGPQAADWSLGRFPDGEDKWGRMVPSPGPTPTYPGGPNSDTVPFVNFLDFDPPLVSPGQIVTFRARAWDDGPLAGVTLHFNPLSGTPQEVPMLDDGKVPDAVAGDGVYTAALEVDTPGKVFYAISAVDSDGNVTRVPANSSAFMTLFVGNGGEHPVISEIVAANRRCPCGGEPPPGCELGGTDVNADADDWVEIFNPTNRSISLGSYYLTDRMDWLTKWQFPAVTLRPAQWAIVWCDGEMGEQPAVSPPLNDLHSRFQLNADKDEVALVFSPSQRQIVSFIRFRNLVADISYGLDPEGRGYGMLMQPTPGAENSPLAANADSIVEAGDDPNNPRPLRPGSTITVVGRALNRTEHVFVVGRRADDSGWDWDGAQEVSFTLNGADLLVQLPSSLPEGRYLLCVLSGYNESWHKGGVPWTRLEFTAGAGGGELFRRGDGNGDGKVDIADAIYTLSYLFAGGGTPPCPDALDANDDGSIDIADAIQVLSYLFAGAELPQPVECGEDPTADDLSACDYPACP